ncbi:unnamed protein product [Candida verbasci]|uniref:HORMA domain-containing protein n=1 Tax=Candida verbasci TaxID=1227364 RepID=A0A9W4X9T6_9ASCO|nr:unnamed protein product [Candida verbasci]
MPTNSKSQSQVTVNESNHLIYQLIATSIYCITYLRDIFEDDNYLDLKFYSSATPSDDFIKIKKLIKGHSSKAEALIHCVEHGIKEAIEFGYLKAIQFIIYTNVELEAHESYLFHIDYQNECVSVSLNNEFEEYTTDSLLSEMQQLIKRLLLVTQTFKTIKDDKNIMVRLLFTDDCPSNYQPPFFQETKESTTIKVLKKESHFEVGSINIPETYVDAYVFVSTTKPEFIEIDPFKHLYPPIGEIPASSLKTRIVKEEAKEVFETQVGTQVVEETFETQVRTQFGIAKCRTCDQEFDLLLFGYELGTTHSIQCYDCIYNNYPLDLQILIKTRKLYTHLENNEAFPTFEELKEIINLESSIIVQILNFLFKFNFIILVNDFNFSTMNEKCISDSFVPPIDGILSNDGSKLDIGKQYFIGFVPNLILKFPFMSFDKDVYSILFPNYKRTRKDLISHNLNKFRMIFYDNLKSSYISDSLNSNDLPKLKYVTTLRYNSSQFSALSQASKSSISSKRTMIEKIKKENDFDFDFDPNETIKEITNDANASGEMSLSDSIDYLASQQPPEPIKRKLENDSDANNGKKQMKVSVNKFRFD